MNFRRYITLIVGLSVLATMRVNSTTIDESSDSPSVVILGEKTSVSIHGFDTIELGIDVSLPMKTFLVELSGVDTSHVFAVSVGLSMSIGRTDPALLYRDIPTSDRSDKYPGIQSSIAEARLGTQTIHLIDFVESDGRHYARLIYFPVTVDSTGTLTFNQRVDLSLDDRPLAPQNLLSADILRPAYNGKTERSPLSQASTDPRYLIVTSLPLQASFERLARYKRETGYDARVEIIDDILAGYSGRDDAERLRERLKDFYFEGGLYVLLAGDETQLPIRYAYPTMTQTMPAMADLQVCDLYFADMTGDWDSDSDGVWGEKYADQPDLTPELLVGRLPFSSPAEADNYVNKLIGYETNPGNGDESYLTRAFFFSSDQMRDYGDIGEHGTIAVAFPTNFQVDTSNGIEQAHGDDPNPSNKSATELLPILSSGYGIVNVIAHGRSDAFGVRTAGYNDWPKSYLTTIDEGGTNGNVNGLDPNGKISFYYSLACDNGGFDLDQPPISEPNPNLVEALLGVSNAGAVGFVAHSRWGWISSSHLVQKTFFDSLFSHPGRPAVLSLYDAKAEYYYYRDQIYGINYYGDPTVSVYTSVPRRLILATTYSNAVLTATVTDGIDVVPGTAVILSMNGEVISENLTGPSGQAQFAID